MELTPEQIAVENVRVGREKVLIKDLEEMFLNPYLPMRFLEDETVLGTTVQEELWDGIIIGEDKGEEGEVPFILFLKEKFGDNLPERYKKGAELLEKAEEMKKPEAVSHITTFTERVMQGKFKLKEEEKIAIIKAFRYPEEFLSEIKALYSVSEKIGENVLNKVGLNIGITPTNTAKFFKDKFALPGTKLAIFYFTNHYWYGKDVAFELFVENAKTSEIPKDMFKSIPQFVFKDIVRQVEKPEFKFYWEKLKVDLSLGLIYNDSFLCSILAHSSDKEMRETARARLEKSYGIVFKEENAGKKVKLK